jgi:5-methylcytosine-specific restriction enzyme A
VPTPEAVGYFPPLLPWAARHSFSNPAGKGEKMYDFRVDRHYSRKDVYREIGLPIDTKGGNWDTGYNKFNNDYFIFSNVGIPGRTGHDYANRFTGNDFYWFAKNDTRIDQPQIRELLSPPGYVYIFYRTDNTGPFTFAGTGRPKSFQETTPVQITWEILNDFDEQALPKGKVDQLPEGQKKQITSNSYERNPEARRRCVDHYGYRCTVCDFDFQTKYGDLGRDFIHVHHLKAVSEIGELYY